jgi:hypothetical protein
MYVDLNAIFSEHNTKFIWLSPSVRNALREEARGEGVTGKCRIKIGIEPTMIDLICEPLRDPRLSWIYGKDNQLSLAWTPTNFSQTLTSHSANRTTNAINHIRVMGQIPSQHKSDV